MGKSLSTSRATEDEGGRWISWFEDGKTYEGGKWYTEVHGFDTLPLLIRPGAAIPINPKLETPMDDPLDGLRVLVNNTVDVDVELTVVNPQRTHEVVRHVRSQHARSIGGGFADVVVSVS
jgi:alpha-D-xyloside xylohydrolase